MFRQEANLTGLNATSFIFICFMTLLLKYGTKKKKRREESEETSLGRMVDAHKINKTNGSMQIARRGERFVGVVGIVIVVVFFSFAGAAAAVAVVMSDK